MIKNSKYIDKKSLVEKEKKEKYYYEGNDDYCERYV